MTSRDRSQTPVEQLAQYLLEQAHANAELQRRAPANDDEVLDGSDPLQPSAVELRLSAELQAAAAPLMSDDLEELISFAISSAQNAGDVSQHAIAASRRASRYMAVAAGLSVLGMVIGAIGAGAAFINWGPDPALVRVADEVRAIGGAQQQIKSQLADLQAQTAAPQNMGLASQRRETGMTESEAASLQRVLPTRPAPTERATTENEAKSYSGFDSEGLRYGLGHGHSAFAGAWR